MKMRLAGQSCAYVAALFATLNTFAIPHASAVQGGAVPSSHSAIAQVSVSLGDLSSASLSRSFCSGTLISEQAVVTAAHCLLGKTAAQVVVQFGVEGLSTTVLRPGMKIVIPLEYQPYDQLLPDARETHDIAILFFAGGMPSGFKAAVMVDQELTQASNQTIVSIAGFGAPQKGTLRTCATKIEDAQFSRSEFELLSDSNCALGGGDSGGAVYVVLNHEVQLYGLHNWGWHHPDGSVAYSVETRMSFYGPWIRTLSANSTDGR